MPAGPLRPGDPERLGDHRILGRLGEGGQGIVYLGTTPGDERVAIKVLTGGLDRSFERELAAARQVAEFCTARVIAADLDHRPPYVVSEFIDGPTLHQVSPLRGAALTRVAIATATALTAIHRAGVVHRDFKPANVLMAADGPRVIDFGIARLADSTTAGSGIVGTPRYMAPEQFGDRPVGSAADVFAWGCTMVFAATGHTPFGGDSIPAAIHRILSSEPDLSGLAEPLRSIVLRCLDKDPARRPAARDVLFDLLGESRPAGEAEALRQGAIAAAPASVSRRNLLVGAGVLSAALAATAAIVWRQASGGPVTVTASRSATSTLSPTGTPTGNTSETPVAGTPPPAQPQPLAAALQAALAVTPMADFVHDGGLSQSDFYATAKGRLVYDPVSQDGANSVNFAMTITTSSGDDEVVVIGEGDREGVYLNGRKAKGAGEDGIELHARFVASASSVGVLADVVALTPKLSANGRVYAGSLVATGVPQSLQDILTEIAGGWSREELAQSTLSWQLTLDGQDRPRAFKLVWRAPIQEAVLTSSWTTTYSGWRTGTIRAPQ
ncbi:serine/threonine-protein kinase [Nonomuraea sp. LPB2021202275-12-8]|uniref:serine/threonine-protein kinase n=1 Tax=Nonomuraea sp. LPB2021202275-12-8 TaxID=3120159 RepID=UPI00300CE348